MYWNINLKGETCQHCDQDKIIGRFGCKLIFTLSALFGQSCSCKMSASLSVTCPDAASFRIGSGALFSAARFSSSTSRQFWSYRLKVHSLKCVCVAGSTGRLGSRHLLAAPRLSIVSLPSSRPFSCVNAALQFSVRFLHPRNVSLACVCVCAPVDCSNE